MQPDSSLLTPLYIYSSNLNGTTNEVSNEEVSTEKNPQNRFTNVGVVGQHTRKNKYSRSVNLLHFLNSVKKRHKVQ